MNVRAHLWLEPLQIHRRLGKESWVLLDAVDRPRGVKRSKHSRDPTVTGSRVDHSALSWRLTQKAYIL